MRCTYVGAIIEGPGNITYLPGLTPLPIELTCNVTGTTAVWIINGTDFLLRSLANGNLAGHNVNGSNILVDSPVNNTKYICVSVGANDVSSDPAYITIAGT